MSRGYPSEPAGRPCSTCAIAVVVTLSLTWVGLLVINSLLVLPGAAARNVAKNMRQYTWLALLGAVVCRASPD